MLHWPVWCGVPLWLVKRVLPVAPPRNLKYAEALVVYDDPTYLTDRDHPKKAAEAGFVLQHSRDAG